MQRKLSNILLLIFIVVPSISGQNVGIDINNPTEKLQVNGVMHTAQGGVRFPDGTLQTSAAMSIGTDGGIPEFAVNMYFSYDTNNNPPTDYSDWVQIYGLNYDHYRDPGNPQTCLENLVITKTIDEFSVDLYWKRFINSTMLNNEIHLTRLINGTELPVIVIDLDLIAVERISKSTIAVGNGKYKMVEEVRIASGGAITITYNDYDAQGNVIFSTVEVVCN